jgi:hypothetical protein
MNTYQMGFYSGYRIIERKRCLMKKAPVNGAVVIVMFVVFIGYQ